MKMTTQTIETQNQNHESNDSDPSWRVIVNGVDAGQISVNDMTLSHSIAQMD